MSFLRIYLIAYFALIAAAIVELWRSGILVELPLAWVVLVLGVAVGLGAVLAFASRRDVASGS